MARENPLRGNPALHRIAESLSEQGLGAAFRYLPPNQAYWLRQILAQGGRITAPGPSGGQTLFEQVIPGAYRYTAAKALEKAAPEYYARQLAHIGGPNILRDAFAENPLEIGYTPGESAAISNLRARMQAGILGRPPRERTAEEFAQPFQQEQRAFQEAGVNPFALGNLTKEQRYELGLLTDKQRQAFAKQRRAREDKLREG
jgi:hypothetical protein